MRYEDAFRDAQSQGEPLHADVGFRLEVERIEQLRQKRALDVKAGNCDLVHSHRERAPEGKERLGFAWKGGLLQLFNIKALKQDRYACETKPFLTLTPQPNT